MTPTLDEIAAEPAAPAGRRERRTMPADVSLPESPRALLTPAQAALLLGVKLPTIYQWARERRIPSVKLMGALRFERPELERLIRRARVPALRDGPLADAPAACR